MAVRHAPTLWALLATATLLASCGVGGPTAPGDSADDAPAAQADAPTEAPRGEGDPCDRSKEDSPYLYECHAVAWVDLDSDGVADPIAMTATSAPALILSAHVGGRRIEHTLEQTPSAAPPLGPGTVQGGIEIESMLHKAFFGAYDFSGDGTPFLVVWTSIDESSNDFRVFRYTGSSFELIQPPTEGVYARDTDWVTITPPPHPTYRCTGEPAAGLEVTRYSPPNQPRYQTGTMTVLDHEFIASSPGFFEVGEEDTVPLAEVPTNDLGIDCEDMAQHARPGE